MRMLIDWSVLVRACVHAMGLFVSVVCICGAYVRACVVVHVWFLYFLHAIKVPIGQCADGVPLGSCGDGLVLMACHVWLVHTRRLPSIATDVVSTSSCDETTSEETERSRESAESV